LPSTFDRKVLVRNRNLQFSCGHHEDTLSRTAVDYEKNSRSLQRNSSTTAASISPGPSPLASRPFPRASSLWRRFGGMSAVEDAVGPRTSLCRYKPSGYIGHGKWI
jgi:hypothetical protein